MAFSLIPDRVYSSIFEIDGTELSRRGVSLLLADLDNTLAKYGQPDPEPAVQQWKCGLAEAGVELFLLSNSRKPARAGHYARCLKVPYLGHAGKPRTDGPHACPNRHGGGSNFYGYTGGQTRWRTGPDG